MGVEKWLRLCELRCGRVSLEVRLSRGRAGGGGGNAISRGSIARSLLNVNWYCVVRMVKRGEGVSEETDGWGLWPSQAGAHPSTAQDWEVLRPYT